MSSENEIAQPLKEFIGILSDRTGNSSGQVIAYIESAYGITLSDVSEDDAEAFSTAVMDDHDTETVREILEKYDAPEEGIENAVQEVEALKDAESGNESAPADDGDDTEERETAERASDESAGDIPDEKIESAVKRHVPSADEIASAMQDQTGGGGGSGQSAEQAQQQWAQMIAKHFLQSQSGGGQMAELGQMMDKAAKKNLVRQLTKPSFGDIMEKKMYEKMGDKYADEWAEDMFGGDPFEEIEELESEDDDDSDGGLWSW